MNYTPEFLEFWVKYPSRWDRQASRRIKRRKGPAFKSWQKLTPDIQDECLRKVRYIKQFEGSAVRDPVTWLNQCGWEDIDIKPKPNPIVSKDTADSILKSVSEEPVLDTKTINKALKENER